MITATFIRKAEGFNGDARLYRLSESVPYGWDNGKTDHVIVSGVCAFDTGLSETYIFPADATGEVLNWTDMPGSFRGSIDHKEAIERAGWNL